MQVEVECDVPRQDTVSTGFKPNRTVINSVPHVTGSTHYSSSMKFYTDASYFKEINGNPVSLKTGMFVTCIYKETLIVFPAPYLCVLLQTRNITLTYY